MSQLATQLFGLTLIIIFGMWRISNLLVEIRDRLPKEETVAKAKGVGA